MFWKRRARARTAWLHSGGGKCAPDEAGRGGSGGVASRGRRTGVGRRDRHRSTAPRGHGRVLGGMPFEVPLLGAIALATGWPQGVLPPADRLFPVPVGRICPPSGMAGSEPAVRVRGHAGAGFGQFGSDQSESGTAPAAEVRQQQPTPARQEGREQQPQQRRRTTAEVSSHLRDRADFIRDRFSRSLKSLALARIIHRRGRGGRPNGKEGTMSSLLLPLRPSASAVNNPAAQIPPALEAPIPLAVRSFVPIPQKSRSPPS